MMIPSGSRLDLAGNCDLYLQMGVERVPAHDPLLTPTPNLKEPWHCGAGGPLTSTPRSGFHPPHGREEAQSRLLQSFTFGFCASDHEMA